MNFRWIHRQQHCRARRLIYRDHQHNILSHHRQKIAKRQRSLMQVMTKIRKMTLCMFAIFAWTSRKTVSWAIADICIVGHVWVSARKVFVLQRRTCSTRWMHGGFIDLTNEFFKNIFRYLARNEADTSTMSRL